MKPSKMSTRRHVSRMVSSVGKASESNPDARQPAIGTEIRAMRNVVANGSRPESFAGL